MHHFPKKDDLVVSALEHVFELRLSEMRAAVAKPPPGTREDHVAVLIDAIWPLFKGPTFYAWLELVVAGRTDPALKVAVSAASLRFWEQLRVGLGTLLDWPTDREDKLYGLLDVVVGQLEAMALERTLLSPGETDSPRLVRRLGSAKRVSAALVRDLDSSDPIEK
jgi:AcrR family transcriptional regulator